MALYTPRGSDSWSRVVLSSLSLQSVGLEGIMVTGGGTGAAAWPAANLVIYVPFWLSEPLTVTKLWLAIGAPAGTIDVGIYDSVGNLLVSAGSTTVTASAALQVMDVTDTTLNRGNYYFGTVASTVTTLTIERYTPAAGICQAFGLLEQTSAAPPLATNASPATFAKYTRANIPRVGLLANRTAL